MELTELKRGDLLFYDFHPFGGEYQVAAHVAIVQSYKAPRPKVIHLDISGILLSTLSDERLVYTTFHAIRSSDQAVAEKAATTAFNWLIYSNCKKYISRSGRNSVLLSKGIFNKLALTQASYRSSSYGRDAHSFVQRLCRECSDAPPVELTQSSSLFDRGAFCSGFVIAAYQTALGEQLCPTHLALDARNTKPLRFKKYLDTHSFWQHAGTIQSTFII